ncbi:hypothetical protein GV827_22880 [Sulfitobacter sp. JBTF-M27]|uniref:Uncharacterized protein n=1 Tax=Sulfitobacter sediminilitoris TaxID=2698830 RepID=A0A6P0CKX6_9RHOB|nr:hypothetical protein [Sulfitobacter sediminilitoris]NEK25213.1 hypothetical protein [Sulfitobacter sediminilitoris]
MTLTFPVFKLPTMKWMFRGTIAKPATDVTPEHETAYAERAFLRELLTRNPEGIQSDLGLMAMMTQYPRHF